jgi:3',5'-cyclic AMP phosphodiesterase CpdA
VTTDLHYLARDLHDEGPAFRRFVEGGDGKDLVHIDAILDAFAGELSLLGPDLLIVTGDLTNNGERKSHLAVAARLAAIQARGVHVLVLPGNHDIKNPYARGFVGGRQVPVETIGPEDFASIYAPFGYTEALSRDGASLSYLAAADAGLWILMLDSNHYLENAAARRPVTGGSLGPETLAWIGQCALRAKAAGARLAVAMHHSLLDHSSVITRGFTLENGEEVASLLAGLGIELVMTGHIHIQDVARAERGGERIWDVATNALSVYPHQYGLLAFSQAEASFSYETRRVDVAAWARAGGSTDPELLGFASYAEASFKARAVAMAARVFEGGVYTASERRAIEEALGTLNARYFAGRQGENRGDPDLAPGLGLLLDLPSGFMAAYAESILNDDGMDDNRFSTRP